jgi:Membrane proteins related to metalloendopeptidases
MKKVMTIMLCMSLTASLLFVPTTTVEAKTLGQLKTDLNNLEASLKKNQEEKALTESQINTAKANVENIKVEITKTNEEIQKLVGEITKLNKEIEKKNEEIKSVINFVQVANGESAYMEYVFGAKDFTDFIYRITISEQMVDYNDKLVEEYNAMVKKNQDKTKELQTKQVLLGQKQQELEVQMSVLSQKAESLAEGQLDLASQIKAQKEAIGSLKGCKDSETASSCAGRLAAEAAANGGYYTPSGTGFSRPTTTGRISSEYGWRYHPTMGTYRLHTGIDIAATGTVPIYASASGRVAAISRRTSCGGNVIYIHHNINGKTYTSVYMHLRTMNVSVGQIVTPATQIATMGGDPRIETWDGCSTGQHLHFTMANGLYFIDYSSYSTFESKTFNPRQVVSFPATGGSFSGR